MIVIIDYQAGNLKSLSNALFSQGIDCVISQDPALIKSAKLAILPGVGAFEKAMQTLNTLGISEALKWRYENGKPILGICLGMQLFFEQSEEDETAFGQPQGLGFLNGNIVKIKPQDERLKVPHMGWNQLKFMTTENMSPEVKTPLSLYDHTSVYFVHSYGLEYPNPEHTVFVADYGMAIPAMTYKPACKATGLGALVGFQFHPEKSGAAGQALLKTTIELLCS